MRIMPLSPAAAAALLGVAGGAGCECGAAPVLARCVSLARVESVEPAQVRAGCRESDPVTVRGSGLSGATVLVDGIPLAGARGDDTAITGTVPSGANKGRISLQDLNGCISQAAAAAPELRLVDGPRFASLFPPAGSEVSILVSQKVCFDRAIVAAAGALQLFSDGRPVPGSLRVDGTCIVFKPTQPLAYERCYRASWDPSKTLDPDGIAACGETREWDFSTRCGGGCDHPPFYWTAAGGGFSANARFRLFATIGVPGDALRAAVLANEDGHAPCR
jgi:hypothetical protein